MIYSNVFTGGNSFEQSVLFIDLQQGEPTTEKNYKQ